MTANKTYFGNYPATILSYDAVARTVQVNIPTVTDGLDDGITAKLAYPVGHDDKDTELLIFNHPDCYVFFERGEPESPVVFAFRSHGVGAVVDYRRIRQKNIELLATAKVNIDATDEIDLTADTVRIKAKNLIFDTQKTLNMGDFTNNGEADLKSKTTIEGKEFMQHQHGNVQSGPSSTGGVT